MNYHFSSRPESGGYNSRWSILEVVRPVCLEVVPGYRRRGGRCHARAPQEETDVCEKQGEPFLIC